jgi:hypothetical protein
MGSLTSNKLRELLLNGGIDPLADTLKVMLVGSGYTPDKDHSFADSITGGTSKELSGTGYTGGFGGSGRKALASKAVTKDDSANVAYLDAADLTWTAIDAGTVAYLAVIKEVTSDADSPILCIVDVEPNVVTNGGDYTVTWAADGVFKIS